MEWKNKLSGQKTREAKLTREDVVEVDVTTQPYIASIKVASSEKRLQCILVSGEDLVCCLAIARWA